MKSIGEQLQYSSIMGDGGTIVHVSQVAHVTFYITSEGSERVWGFHLFSESEKRGLEESYQSPYRSYEEATQALLQEQVKLEEILERKRKGMPTQKQVYFLFTNRIPIPLDLTWGQASDIIDEKMVQLDKEKQEYFRKKAEKYHGFAIGMRVSHSYRETRDGPLKRFEGEITKLTSSNDGLNKYAWVKFDGDKHSIQIWIANLRKIEESEPELMKT